MRLAITFYGRKSPIAPARDAIGDGGDGAVTWELRNKVYKYGLVQQRGEAFRWLVVTSQSLCPSFELYLAALAALATTKAALLGRYT